MTISYDAPTIHRWSFSSLRHLNLDDASLQLLSIEPVNSSSSRMWVFVCKRGVSLDKYIKILLIVNFFLRLTLLMLVTLSL